MRRLGVWWLLVATAAFAALLTGSVSRAAAHSVTPAVGNVRPEISALQTPKPGSTNLFDCQSEPLDTQDRCYSPQQLQQAYGLSGLLAQKVNGDGETIVIVDAYANPYIATDLKVENSTFGLPEAKLKVVAPFGVPKFDVNDFNQLVWAVESSLDVLSAHAMAPKADIVLVQAASSGDADMLAATKYAVDKHLGDVLSQSFGEAESCVDPGLLGQEHTLFQSAVAQGMTLFASSGDSGAALFSCDGSSAIQDVSSPASDPLVTGVGGTTLNADDPAGNYIGETAWTEPAFGCNPPALDLSDGCSGGGYSTLYDRPAYQQSLVTSGSGRGVPDVSYNAGVNGGLLIHSGALLVAFFGLDPKTPAFFAIGGTSAGSPQWSALAADAAQLAGHPLGNINPSLYQLAGQPSSYAADLHDVTVGNNDVSEIGAGFDAGTGWDPVTGLGTPNAAGLLPALASGCYVANVNGPLTATSGQSVCLLPGSIIHGPLTISGAPSVTITGATITGPVTIAKSGAVEFDNNTVTGPLTFKDDASVHQSGNHVAGPIKIS